MTTPFWYNEPTILFKKENVLQLWPTKQMTNEAKLNAISRLVILMCILGFLFTQNWKIFIIGIITLAIIFSLYNLRKQKIIKEGFKFRPENDMKNTIIKDRMTHNPVTLESVLRSNFHPTTKKNPFGNVLLTDIGDSPDRLAAAPSFNPDVYDDITKVVKKQTQMLNPDIINTNKQIYGDLFENYNLDKSMMRFYSTANTRVENDQGAYSKFLYGGMYSSKEDTPEGAMMRVKNNIQYINP
jgi:hypothetical protein